MGGGLRRTPALLHDDTRALVRAGTECRAHLLPDPLGNRHIGLGVRALGFGDDDRPAAVGGLADLHVERQLAQELYAELLGLAPRPAYRARS